MLSIDLQFEINKKRNLVFNPEQKKIITKSARTLIEIINGENFREEVLGHVFRRKKRFFKTRDSNEQIFKKILSGNDKFIDENRSDSNQLNDGDIDILVIPYKAFKRGGKPKIGTVGKTYKNTYRTWINLFNLDYRIKNYSDSPMVLQSLIAQNLIHEYCHNLGYSHTKRGVNDRTNKYSVPYGLGEIVKNLIQKKASDTENIFIKVSELEEIPSCSYNCENE